MKTMRERFDGIALSGEAKHGERHRLKQLKELRKLVPDLLDGYEEAEYRLDTFDYGDIQVWSGVIDLDEKNTVYALTYTYEEPQLGPTTSLYLFRIVDKKPHLEQMAFREDKATAELQKILSDDGLSDSVSDLIHERLEYIRFGQAYQLLEHPNLKDHAATQPEATKLIALIEAALEYGRDNE